jgi:hypothetical protein
MDNNMNFGYEPTAPHSANPGGNPGRGRLIAGAAAATVLIGGAAFGAVTMLSDSPAAAVTGPTGQAAVLNDALTTAATPASTASTASGGTTAGSAATQTRHTRDALARLRRLGGIDGQFTFETKTGPQTLAFERGTIQSVSGKDVVVRATDGTTWSWTLVTDSVVRDNGTKTATSSLASGDLVFVGGPVVSGSRDARLIVIRTPKKASSPTASPSASTSSALG